MSGLPEYQKLLVPAYLSCRIICWVLFVLLFHVPRLHLVQFSLNTRLTRLQALPRLIARPGAVCIIMSDATLTTIATLPGAQVLIT